MDEFAQSREDDDLFADEFEPISETTSASTQERGNRHGSTTVGQTGKSTASSKPPSEPASHRGGRGGGTREDRRGGRGGGRGSGTGGGLASSRYASAAEKTNEQLDGAKQDTKATASAPPEPAATPKSTEAPITTGPTKVTESGDNASESIPPPSEPQTPQQPSRPTAVRGDRHLTGGPAHKKLTEAELSQKMEKMKILNAQKAERFRLSEEDSAAYARKEKEMAKKRVEEQKNARAMDMERAKNRQRKLAAQGGREWDSEKQDTDIVDGKGRGRSSEYVRGGHGGVIRGGLAGHKHAQPESEDGESGRGGRGRGGFDIRGRGNRGGRAGSRGAKSTSATVPTSEDFPDLPTAPKPAAAEPKKKTEVVIPVSKPAGDWAEEMATPVEETKIGA